MLQKHDKYHNLYFYHIALISLMAGLNVTLYRNANLKKFYYMKHIAILGAGTAGTMMANKLRRELKKNEWSITIVDEHHTHYYQPGFLFIPFGIYKKEDVIKPKEKFIPKGVDYIHAKIEKIDGASNTIHLEKDLKLKYDYCIIATGTETRPDQTPGLVCENWYKNIFDFYTYPGAVALSEFFKTWEGGKLVVSIAEIPFKCPVAPLEFVFLADDYFTKKGIRDKVDITIVTPQPGVFTKPIATKKLSELVVKKNINVVSEFYLESVNGAENKICSYDGREIPYDCLTIVPVNMGSEMIAASGMGDDLNFVRTNKHTLQSEQFPNIFVIGDATNIPTSKAGSVAHFAADVLQRNILSVINGKAPLASFDGHANCYVETGKGKAILIDFNYTTEPLEGKYPLAVAGPFSLLGVSRINHWGKLLFKWIYWNILLPGREMPVTSHMSLKGKIIPADMKARLQEENKSNEQVA